MQSNLYSFSFAPNPDWPRSYSEQPEIQAYLQATADRFGVREHCVFGADVTAARWDDAARRWHVTDDGRRVPRPGARSRPPARWPTRPTPTSPAWTPSPARSCTRPAGTTRHDLAGEKVAVIGTGASAIQVVPAIQPIVDSVAVYQRTPAWVVPRTDHPVKPLMRLLYRLGPRAAEGRPRRASTCSASSS